MTKVSGKPDSIGNYLTIDLTRDILGVSSTGYVIRTSFSDEQAASSRPCALKRIQTMDEEPPDHLANLSHENVVQLMHYWTEERDLFLVMELMDGNLAMLMAEIKRAGASPFSLPVAVDIMLQIAKGMLHLHEIGVSHPQLKCENVLYKLTENKTEAFEMGDVVVKLGGFGCSRPADRNSKNRDMLCFGLTCLEILTGHSWSDETCGTQMVLDMVFARASLPESTPAILRDCIVSCLDAQYSTFSGIVTMLQGAKSYVMQTSKDEMTCSSASIQTKIEQTRTEDESSSIRTLIVGFEEIFAVHQLHPQPGDLYTSVRATLIFFHGFHKVPDEWRRTWTTRNNKVVWPQKWLPEDLGEENIRVLSVSFDANSNVSNVYNRFEMGKNLVQRLVLSPRWKLGENTEEAIFLVGHSFGGVLIKSLVTEARSFIIERVQLNTDQQEVRKCENFLKRLATIVFYSVPHGAPAAVDFEFYIAECRKIAALQRSSFLQSLREDVRFGTDMNKLSADFDSAVPEKVGILAFLEGKPIKKRLLLITKNSCEGITEKVRSWDWHKIDKDNHFEVCRPDSKNHAGYKILLNHLQQHMSAPYGLTSTPSEVKKPSLKVAVFALLAMCRLKGFVRLFKRQSENALKSYSYNEDCKERATIGSTNSIDHEGPPSEALSVLGKRQMNDSLSIAFSQPPGRKRTKALMSLPVSSGHEMFSGSASDEKIYQENKDQGEDFPGDSNVKVLNKDHGSNTESNRSDLNTTMYRRFCIPPNQMTMDEFLRSPIHILGTADATAASSVVPQLVSENWVACVKCEQWRLLMPQVNPDTLPNKWLCEMMDWLWGTRPGMNHCKFKEEETTAAVYACYANLALPTVRAGDVPAMLHASESSSCMIQSLRPLPVPEPSSQSPPSLTDWYRSSDSSICGSTGEGQAVKSKGVMLADLEKIGVLGAGSGGKVYKVRHRWTGKVYALKVIQEKLELAVRGLIIMEMEMLRTSKSQHLLECSGVFDTEGKISFVLEYMDGGTLADVLKHRKKIDERYLAEVTKQALLGLIVLQKHKIVHGNIKPSNLLLNRKHEVKIADCGVSTRLASTLAQCNSFGRTFAYMSPEQFDPHGNGGDYGYAADIWGLGLTLLECAIGRYPCLQPGENPDWPTLTNAICWREPPSPPAEASPEFRNFIILCLQKESIRRPSAEMLLTHPFVRRYEGQPCAISELVQDLVFDLQEIPRADQISREQVPAEINLQQDEIEDYCKEGRVRFRENLGKYVVEYRPPHFMWKLWMGTYATVEEAQRACDCARFYAGQEKGGFYFKDSPSLFAELGPLNRPFTLVSKDVKDKAFNVEVKKRAKQVIRKLKDAQLDKQFLSITYQPTATKPLQDAVLQSPQVLGARTSTHSHDSLRSLPNSAIAYSDHEEIELAESSLQELLASAAPEAGDSHKNPDSFTTLDPS